MSKSSYPKKYWNCKGHQPIGRPYGKYEVKRCNCGCCDSNVKSAFARQKCSCGQTHRVQYIPHWVDDCCAKKGNWNFL